MWQQWQVGAQSVPVMQVIPGTVNPYAQQMQQMYYGNYQQPVPQPLIIGSQPPVPGVNPAPPVEPPTEEKPPLPPEPPPPEEGQPEDLKPLDPNEAQKFQGLQQQAAQWQQQKQWQEYQQQMNQYKQQMQQMTQGQSIDDIMREEQEFNIQYSDWKNQYDTWKEQNKNHPNREQFMQYEQQWKTYEKQMEEKRAVIQQKKEAVLRNQNQANQNQGQMNQGPGNNFNNNQSQRGGFNRGGFQGNQRFRGPAPNQFQQDNNSNFQGGRGGRGGRGRGFNQRGGRFPGPNRFDSPGQQQQQRFDAPGQQQQQRFGGPGQQQNRFQGPGQQQNNQFDPQGQQSTPRFDSNRGRGGPRGRGDRGSARGGGRGRGGPPGQGGGQRFPPPQQQQQQQQQELPDMEIDSPEQEQSDDIIQTAPQIPSLFDQPQQFNQNQRFPGPRGRGRGRGQTRFNAPGQQGPRGGVPGQQDPRGGAPGQQGPRGGAPGQQGPRGGAPGQQGPRGGAPGQGPRFSNQQQGQPRFQAPGQGNVRPGMGQGPRGQAPGQQGPRGQAPASTGPISLMSLSFDDEKMKKQLEKQEMKGNVQSTDESVKSEDKNAEAAKEPAKPEVKVKQEGKEQDDKSKEKVEDPSKKTVKEEDALNISKTLTEKEHEIIRKAAAELKMMRQQAQGDLEHPEDERGQTFQRGGQDRYEERFEEDDRRFPPRRHDRGFPDDDFRSDNRYIDDDRFDRRDPYYDRPPRPDDEELYCRPYPPDPLYDRDPFYDRLPPVDRFYDDPYRRDEFDRLPPPPPRDTYRDPYRDPYLDDPYGYPPPPRRDYLPPPSPPRAAPEVIDYGHQGSAAADLDRVPAKPEVIDYGHGSGSSSQRIMTVDEYFRSDRERERERSPLRDWERDRSPMREREREPLRDPYRDDPYLDRDRGRALDRDRDRGRDRGSYLDREDRFDAYDRGRRDRSFDRDRDRFRDLDRDLREPDRFSRDRGDRYPPPPKPEPRLPERGPLFDAYAPKILQPVEKQETVLISDLLDNPGRLNRPSNIVVILRGPPGSGKTYVSKLIREKEVGNGSSAPRMLCLDDYFMIEIEKIEKDPDTGKKVKKKVMEYEYEPELEETYRQSLFKSFKKNIDDGFFSFIIVDAVNDRVRHFEEFWSYAKSKGFQVYIADLEGDPSVCAKRNTHKRSQREIQRLIDRWEKAPSHYINLDIRSLLQEDSITEVEMEDTTDVQMGSSSKKEEIKKEEEEEEEFQGVYKKSKWELDTSENQLDKLDGLVHPKKPHHPQRLEDYLQLPDDYNMRRSQPGKKRVRWADIEERAQQMRSREIGFVLGQTNWERMTDDTYAERALNRTKYI